jgi:hypothetical protein
MSIAAVKAAISPDKLMIVLILNLVSMRHDILSEKKFITVVLGCAILIYNSKKYATNITS